MAAGWKETASRVSLGTRTWHILRLVYRADGVRGPLARLRADRRRCGAVARSLLSVLSLQCCADGAAHSQCRCRARCGRRAGRLRGLDHFGRRSGSSRRACRCKHPGRHHWRGTHGRAPLRRALPEYRKRVRLFGRACCARRACAASIAACFSPMSAPPRARSIFLIFETLSRSTSARAIRRSTSALCRRRSTFVYAAIARLFATTTTYPHEVVRTRVRQREGRRRVWPRHCARGALAVSRRGLARLLQWHGDAPVCAWYRTRQIVFVSFEIFRQAVLGPSSPSTSSSTAKQ
jgi:hypothetical protein